MRRDRLPRVFAVVRFDHFADLDVPLEHQFTVVRVMQEQAEASREVDRLNALNSDKDCRYYVQVTRWQAASGDVDSETD